MGHGLGALQDAGSGVVWVLGTLLLATTSDSVSGLVTRPVGEGAAAKTFTATMGALLYAVAVALLVARRRRDLSVESGGLPPPSRGLICLVSNRESILRAVEHHASVLEGVWLIHTPESEELAKTLKDEVRTAHDLERWQVKLEPIGDVKLQADTEAAVRAVFDSLGPLRLRETDVVCDFTGMTKPASAGMIVACLSRSRKLQYSPFEYSPDAQRQMRPDPSKPLDPVYIHIVRQRRRHSSTSTT